MDVPSSKAPAAKGIGSCWDSKDLQVLPDDVVEAVFKTYEMIAATLGEPRFEWVHDGGRVWIVQLHKGATASDATTLVPGEPTEWAVFKSSQGLEELRAFLDRLPAGVGVEVEGQIGLTSHIADLLRKTKRPARIAPDREAA